MNEGFIELVKDLRIAQVRHAKSKSAADMAECKRLEVLVDEAIRAGAMPDGHGYKQGVLFGDNNIGAYGKGK